ncbi:MAG: glutathione S-transferase family protein [Deltaproteobacteria bacterium]|nr:glutathione S-transferase family protein [Deltaproteobacteria bacterium]MBW2545683.1 glutathione S-transferase family protein [Deltaproteobacteria bacterium]MBW2717318.1 glutathione S-transferase family protein [Deltaproteobacteria bacterium]
MPNLKLTYFDIHGGRAEPARLAMHIGGVAFEDHRISFREFGANRSSYPFKRVPVLEIDDVALSQGNSINRYVGTLAGLYPSDPLEAAFCDEAMDAVEDIISQQAATMFIKDEDEKKVAREALADGPLAIYLHGVQGMLEARGGEYFAAGRLTVADLKVMVWVRSLRSGILDHVPADLPDKLAPKLVAHLERIDGDPRVQAYYARFA